VINTNVVAVPKSIAILFENAFKNEYIDI
jgi:hypothetical protein